MVFINDSTTIAVINAMTQNTTGSEYLTILLIVFMVFIIGLIFGIDITLISLFVTPLILIIGAYKPEFMPIVIAILVMDGVLLAKNIFFNRT